MDATLNDAQRSAVNRLNGPLLVLAGAGSGKTRVVTARIAKLIQNGTLPNRILAVTFTNRAAQEMQTRVSALMGHSGKIRPHISTFHSLCVRILRRQIHVLGYPSNYTILDSSDQNSVCRKVLREIRVSSSSLRPRDLLYQIGYWKSRGIQPHEATQHADSDKQHLAVVGYRRYQDELIRCGTVDFDDLLLLTERVFREFPDIRRIEASHFDHLLIDEYQDTNDIQYNIVKSLAKDHANICAVGDDDQSIYGFRGSDVRHILNFSEDWADSMTVKLEANYRSTQSILEMANTLIRFNASRYDKLLYAARGAGTKPRVEQYNDDEHEASEVVRGVDCDLQKRGWKPNDIAILFRTNEQPRLFEAELRKHDIPYVLLGSRSFYDRKEVRDLIAYLKIICHPQDEPSLRRIVNNPPRGISSSTIANLVERATQQGVTLWEVMLNAAVLKTMKVPARMAITGFTSNISEQRKYFAGDLSLSLFHQFLAAIEYKKEVERNSNDQQEIDQRWNTVEEFANAFGSYLTKSQNPSLSGFLDELALAANELEEDKDSQLDRDAVALLTLHAAKGLEFPVVYMVGLEEGLLPHARAVSAEGSAIDEERRLAYVGVTRAQDELNLSLALTRRKWGRLQEQHPSRFLFEMIGQADNPHDAAKSRKTKSYNV